MYLLRKIFIKTFQINPSTPGLNLARLFIFLAVIHLGVLAFIGGAVSSEPVREIKVSFFSDGVLVFGKNKGGNAAVKFLRNWSELAQYLSDRNLYIVERGFDGETQTQSYFAPLALQVFERNDHVSVVWRARSQYNEFGLLYNQSLPYVIHAPDSFSGKLISRALQNGDVYPSHFGFALKLESL
jgi:hypothetical protein